MGVGDNNLDILEWALGISVSLYVGTSLLIFTLRGKDIEKMEAQMAALKAEINSDTATIWAELAKQSTKTSDFHEEILRDMSQVATRTDLHNVETRVTQAIRDLKGLS